MHNPLDQFVDKVVGRITLFNTDLCITKAVVSMLLALALVIIGTYWYVRRTYQISSVYSYIVEYAYEFIRDILVQKAGTDAVKYMPFIISLFMTILLNNLLGLIPGLSTATSQLVINICLSLLVFMFVIYVSIANNGLHFIKMFIPRNVPWPILILLIPIELMSFCIKHLSLCIRLSINMMAGHIILKIFAGIIVKYKASIIVILPVLVCLTVFEIFVACMQAYLFTILTSVYINDAMHLH